MKIAILSDLHGEYHNSLPTLAEKVDIILLAGDIVVGWSVRKSQQLIKKFAEEHCQSTILWVWGNHEYYNSPDMAVTMQLWKTWCLENTYNITILDNDVFLIEDLVFHGSTLWTGFNCKGGAFKTIGMLEAERSIADFYKIGLGNGKLITATDMEKLHKEALDFLDKSLTKHESKTNIVISHFPPLLECKHPNIPEGILDTYFNNDLTDLVIKHNINTWVYGHNHWSDNFEIAGCNFISNQLGYPRENTYYSPFCIIDIKIPNK